MAGQIISLVILFCAIHLGWKYTKEKNTAGVIWMVFISTVCIVIIKA